MFHYAHGRYQAALTEARKVDAAHLVYGHLIVAVAAARLGLSDEAAAVAGRVLAIDPDYFAHIAEDLQRRNLHPELIQAIIDGLGDLRSFNAATVFASSQGPRSHTV